MLEDKILYMFETFTKKCQVWYEICCIPFIWHIWKLILPFFCFISFLLLGVFMILINMTKIESINATENCLLIYSVRNFFISIHLFLIHPILIWSRSRGLDLIWLLHNILSNEWELKVVYQQNFLVGKMLVILFLAKAFPLSLAVHAW